MKKLSFVFCFCFLIFTARSQEVNGIIVLDKPNLHVIKVWGTCQERAYAYGFLLADQITDCFTGFIKPSIAGANYETMRNIIIAGEDLSFDSVFIYEAMAMINGITDSTGNPHSMDYVDVLLGNSIEDLSALVDADAQVQCSSLMSWGEATLGTELDGKSVISHHLDLLPIEALYNNSVIVVNFPSEPNTQEWLLVHFAGSLVPIDGVNRHFGVFGQAMSDYTELVLHGKGYLPYGYALRKALEQEDYNDDQYNNVLDVKTALDDCSNGFANPEIVAVLAEAQVSDSLTAMVCEIASNAPTHVYRSNSYPDSIPGDNLYTANSQIARHNAMNFCARYNAIRNNIGNGTLIGFDENWELMKNYSNLSFNIHFEQYSPEADLLKLAVRAVYNVPAYEEIPYVFSLDELFNIFANGLDQQQKDETINNWNYNLSVFPNPFIKSTTFTYKLQSETFVSLCIYNQLGQQVDILVNELQSKGRHQTDWNTKNLPAGFYFYRISTINNLHSQIGKLVKW